MSPSKNQSENLSFISASKVRSSFHDLLLSIGKNAGEGAIEATTLERINLALAALSHDRS